MFSVSIQFRVKVSKSRKKAMKNANLKKSCGVSFVTYANKEIEHMWKKESYSTSRNYRTALHSFLRYRDGKDIMFNEFDSDLIDDYSRWLRHNNICPNTISCYMRSLRAIYNKAVKVHIVRQTYPFNNVFTGIAKTDKRSITIADVSHLQQLDQSLLLGIFCIYSLAAKNSFRFCGFEHTNDFHRLIETHGRAAAVPEIALPLADHARLKQHDAGASVACYHRGIRRQGSRETFHERVWLDSFGIH